MFLHIFLSYIDSLSNLYLSFFDLHHTARKSISMAIFFKILYGIESYSIFSFEKSSLVSVKNISLIVSQLVFWLAQLISEFYLD